jgi:NAD(P)-dependent dehydrogenase (short-subunit alcohol dehydrogenase family)
VVIADIDEVPGRAAAEGIEGAGGRALFVRTDVGDAHDAGALVDATLEWGGRVDVLVNNAGIIKAADFLELTEADFDAVLRVNLKGAFLVGQAAARAMVARGAGGAIVNMSSINAVLAIPNQTPYAVSKGGLGQLTKVMALALAPHGIRVNAIGPGSILTEMLQTVMQDEEARRRVLSRTPLGRCGEPEEVARVALFLASDDASYVTGQTVYADGGRLALNYTVPVKA